MNRILCFQWKLPYVLEDLPNLNLQSLEWVLLGFGAVWGLGFKDLGQHERQRPCVVRLPGMCSLRLEVSTLVLSNIKDRQQAFGASYTFIGTLNTKP